MNKIRKQLLILSSAIIIGIVIFLLSFIPKNIDINYAATLSTMDEPNKVDKNITISMKGKLYRPFFLNARYAGTCVIEGNDITNEYILEDIRFQRTSNEGHLIYSSNVDSSKAIRLGSIWIKDSIDKLLIFCVAPSGILQENVTIAAPAITAEDAIKIKDIWRDDVTISTHKKLN